MLRATSDPRRGRNSTSASSIRDFDRANYREANRAVSRADFANKIGIVQKEAAETQYWIELIDESGISKSEIAQDLHRECSELLAIFTAIGKKLKE